MNSKKEIVVTIFIVIFFILCGIGIWFLVDKTMKTYKDVLPTKATTTTVDTTTESTITEDTTTESTTTEVNPTNKQNSTTTTTTTKTKKIKYADFTTTLATTKVNKNTTYNFYKTTFTIPSGYGFVEGSIEGYQSLQIIKSDSSESIIFIEDHDDKFSDILKDMTEANTYSKSLGCGDLTKKTINNKVYLYSTCTSDGAKFIFALTEYPDGSFNIIYNSKNTTYDNFSSLISKLKLIN
ncbi:MAG: hypothetical protein K5666_05415 [Bacilli bacterium]|nr:hypothetical protein [Bacilli bacterium]